MDLLPYIERMGAAAGVIFAALYFREALKRDAMTTKLIDLLPLVVTAMNSTKASLDTATATIDRELMARRAEDARKAP